MAYLTHNARRAGEKRAPRPPKPSRDTSKPVPGDISTEIGAKRCAARLEQYWLARGYRVRAWVEPHHYAQEMRARFWRVCSDLVDGLPRDFGRADT